MGRRVGNGRELVGESATPYGVLHVCTCTSTYTSRTDPHSPHRSTRSKTGPFVFFYASSGDSDPPRPFASAFSSAEGRVPYLGEQDALGDCFLPVLPAAQFPRYSVCRFVRVLLLFLVLWVISARSL